MMLRTMVVACLLLSQTVRSATKDGDWVLTFADEFDGKALDLAHWSPHDPLGFVRDRQVHQYSPDAADISGGMLHLAARRAPGLRSRGEHEYLAGIVSTYGTFSQTYGRFEIRCRIPAGRGIRAGFSLMPVPSGSLPSVDVFQAAGATTSKIHFANHWGTEQTERSYGEAFSVADLSTGFHTIRLDWEPDSLRWFVDGKEKFQSADGVPGRAMYLMLDAGVGGKLASSPDEETVFPASFDVDYVRVYQKASRVAEQANRR